MQNLPERSTERKSAHVTIITDKPVKVNGQTRYPYAYSEVCGCLCEPEDRHRRCGRCEDQYYIGYL